MSYALPSNSPRMPEYSLMAVLIRGLRDYSSSYAAFARHFPGVAAGTTQDWFDKLFKDSAGAAATVPVFVEGARKTPVFPSVVVMFENESVVDMPLGLLIGIAADGTHVYRMRTTARMTIESRAPQRSVARALAVLLVAIVLHATKALTKEGYSQILYSGTSGPSPEYEYIAEMQGLAGITFFSSSFALTCDVDVPAFSGEPGTATDFLVLEEGLSLDGVPGGVRPSDS